VGVAALAAAYLVVLPVGLAIVVTHNPRAPVEAADLGRPYERVSFETADGLRLAGWYVPSRNRAAVIAFPGRSGPVDHARMLARHGFGVLLLDRRGEGESEGDFNALGWDGENDLTAALAYLRRRPDVDRARIGGLGLSVGGELLLQTAAHHRAPAAVVSEGAGIRSLREQMDTSGPLRWLSPWLVTTAATTVLSGDSPPADLAELMPRIAGRPVFLIHAEHGQGGEELNPAYYDAARAPKALWRIAEGGHTDGLSERPREYERRVVGFFDRALLRRP
jgi:dienelactone hydrolase